MKSVFSKWLKPWLHNTGNPGDNIMLKMSPDVALCDGCHGWAFICIYVNWFWCKFWQYLLWHIFYFAEPPFTHWKVSNQSSYHKYTWSSDPNGLATNSELFNGWSKIYWYLQSRKAKRDNLWSKSKMLLIIWNIDYSIH